MLNTEWIAGDVNELQNKVSAATCGEAGDGLPASARPLGAACGGGSTAAQGRMAETMISASAGGALKKRTAESLERTHWWHGGCGVRRCSWPRAGAIGCRRSADGGRAGCASMSLWARATVGWLN